MRYFSSLYMAFLLLVSNQVIAEGSHYKVGVVPQFNPRVVKQTWQPILNYVEQQTGVKLELSASTRIPEFEKEFEQGKFHFAYMNPYHAVVAKRAQGYEPILHDRSKRLFGIIVVRKDSALTGVSQLDGKKMAMPAPNALGAALIPRAEFATKFKIKPAINYVRSHDSVYLNTALGTVEAGGGVMGTLKRQPQAVQDKLRILYKTGNVAKHPITVHPSVPKNITNKVKNAFLKLGQTEQGQALLKKIPMNEIGTTSFEDYQELIEMGLDKFYIKK